MKNTRFFLISIFLAIGLKLFGQGHGGKLSFEGINHQLSHSVAARAMGGVTINMDNDVGILFDHPAKLSTIDHWQISLGGKWSSRHSQQRQEYAPVRYYANLSLLLEGWTDRIPDPDTSLVGFTAQDTVQRPYDDIGPNWSHSQNHATPLQAVAAIPFTIAERKVVMGIGAAEYADLDHYYQNNNVLDPNILSQRPLPLMRPTDDRPLQVQWTQTSRSRQGSVMGYGMALATGVGKGITVGISNMILRGKTDDLESQISRGKLTFFANAFRVDSLYGRVSKKGTSEFKGDEKIISGLIDGRYVDFGMIVKMPTTITRTYTIQSSLDCTGQPQVSTQKGEEKLQLPWRGSIGIAITPHEHFILGIEYEYRPYDSVTYTDEEGIKSQPWLSSSLLRVGAQYRLLPWLILRGGMRGEAEVFSPEGAALVDEPVTYTLYTAGIGISHANMTLNIAYEHALIKYQDIWSSAISKNSERHHILSMQLIYVIP